jgi:EmrB/QacA subfamily drug resistance transporter
VAKAITLERPRAARLAEERGPAARRWWVLAVLCVSLMMIGLDNTILNVALPTLVRDLHASFSQLQWIIDSYTVVFAGLLLTAGSLGDRFGRKWILLTGLAIFGGGSAFSAFSWSPQILILARALMGVGGAFVMPATLSILTNVFVEPREREKAIGIWAGVAGVGVAIGPIAGGLLLQHFWWGSVFLVNVPVIVVGMIAVALLVPNSSDPAAPRLDLVGATLSTIGLAVLLWGIIEAPTTGWHSERVLVGVSVGLTILAVFIGWELHTDHPMVHLRFFRNRRFSGAGAAIAFVVLGLYGTLFVLTQYLQFVLGYSALGTGLAFVPLAGLLLVAGPVSTLLVRRFGTKIVVSTGLGIIAVGLAWLSTVSAGSPFVVGVLGPFSILGLGFGLTMAPATESIMGSLPRAQAGAGSAMNSTLLQVGGALGVAIIGSVLSAGYRSSVDAVMAGHAVPGWVAEIIRSSIGGALQVAHRAGGSIGQALAQAADRGFMHGMHMAMLVACGFAVVGIIVVVAFLPARAGADPDADAADHGTEDGGAEGHVELAPGSDGTTAEREPTATGARG